LVTLRRSQDLQQQQQQHSLFSQASWGRLEMKPERNKLSIVSNYFKQIISAMSMLTNLLNYFPLTVPGCLASALASSWVVKLDQMVCFLGELDERWPKAMFLFFLFVDCMVVWLI